MYRVVVCRKNTDSFVKWFMRLPLDCRAFIKESYICFLLERGISPSSAYFSAFRNKVSFDWRGFAFWFFGELASWDIRQFVYYRNSNEVVYDFHSFAFWSGRNSDYLERRRVQDSYLTL